MKTPQNNARINTYMLGKRSDSSATGIIMFHEYLNIQDCVALYKILRLFRMSEHKANARSLSYQPCHYVRNNIGVDTN